MIDSKNWRIVYVAKNATDSAYKQGFKDHKVMIADDPLDETGEIEKLEKENRRLQMRVDELKTGMSKAIGELTIASKEVRR